MVTLAILLIVVAAGETAGQDRVAGATDAKHYEPTWERVLRLEVASSPGRSHLSALNIGMKS
jgi:hypothetical protein